MKKTLFVALYLLWVGQSYAQISKGTTYSYEEGEKWYRINITIWMGEMAISMATSDAPDDWQKLTLLESNPDYMSVLVPATQKELKLAYYTGELELLNPAFLVTEKGSKVARLYRTVEIFGEKKVKVNCYKSHNFYGNGVTEYLYVYSGGMMPPNQYEVYYSTSKNTEKIRLQVKAVNKVNEDMHYILGIDVTFPNDNKIYKLVFGLGYTQCVDDTGKVQNYEPISN